MNADKRIPLHDLQKITNDFSEHSRIGRGGYGDVYKGVYNGREIAVKLLHVDTLRGLDDQLFKNEVGNLLKAEHPNIVQLVGYCYETRNIYVDNNGANDFSQRIYKIICFEYLQGGSLDRRLYDHSFAPNWSTRYNIIKGICEGLNFLHKCKPRILHLDLKPANILLDSSMEPNVADFGLSRLFTQTHTHVTEKIIGTQKYMPPEFIKDHIISPKNDVFSVGVVMIEIMTGPTGYSNSFEMGDLAQLRGQVIDNWKNKINATSKYPLEESNQMETCIDTAMRCVEPDRNSRPTIAEVLDILNKTETHIPKRQLADVVLCPTIGSKSTMSDTLKMMIDELENITNQNQHLSSMSNKSSNVRETTSDVEEEVVIGRTEEIKEIVDTICESITPENKITILPIYGIGGIGKTTLAQLVFSDCRFAGYSRVWVYVSQNLDLNKIGNSIISQLSEESHLAEKQMIHNKLRNVLAGKKTLIVLDDVWEENPDTLNSLKAMVRLGAGSEITIIVTTRDEAIAREICHAVEPYKLGTLTDKICWGIIRQKAALEERVDKEQLEQIGREIAIKCGGVALAAQSLGYILRYMSSDQWESVRDSCIWNLSTQKDPSSRIHNVLASLLLSYSHMPDWLKLCFSYCAIFPKGHCIVKYDLIHQWIALGFTEQSYMFDPMQLCENYARQLLGMSFLEYSKTSSTDRTRRQDKECMYFTMHDLVHDLAKEILSHQINTGGNKCRYALLTDCSSSLKLSVAFPANIKALHFRDCGKQELCGGAFSPAQCLRVLDLSECFIQKLPDSIGQLKQLRVLCAPGIQDKMIPSCVTKLSELNYLDLRCSQKISALPDSIGDMKALLHLDLSYCYEICELPESFAELKQLVHLDLTYCRRISISKSFGGFTNLQYLRLAGQTNIDVDRRELSAVIGNLTKLRYLNLSGSIESMITSDKVDSLLASISTLSSLEHLDLSYNEACSSIPENICNLRKLHTLDLEGCKKLKKLPDRMDQMVSLKVLNLKHVRLEELAVSRFNCASLPRFVVHASGDRCCSNIILLQPTNPVELWIDRLENVMSVEEAHSIKLMEKQKIEELRFQWTVATGRFVDDKEVLKILVPPSSVHILTISGYGSVSIPDWFMDIRRYLPILSQLYLCYFPKCNNLPPLGELPNLQWLGLYYMESLQEWNMGYTSGEEGASELPKLECLTIEHCAKLRIKPCVPRATSLFIRGCDAMLSSWGESPPHNGTSSSPLTQLGVEDSKVPMHEWRLLHHLPALSWLSIVSCSDLTTSPGVIQRLSSLETLCLGSLSLNQAELPRWLVELTSLQELTLRECAITTLPEWLGELTSLKNLEIKHCEGIRSLPDSIQQLSRLENLCIDGCPTLEKWFESKENMMKLAHIKDVQVFPLSDYPPDSDEED
ncbi:hypothetical protein CFC21_075387 [Triticum aestivum]|uniref:non-specific serine/threonine protein kinase n=2 Tax=Triticum aestivum TaxID=4565 RepID=A0A3B6MJF7_WHEAT|nr:disease resistance protein RGA2-like isoform X2 [Triticum aestivum]KAF7069808.1 hypothetical protein CFC21_075387 [Triticum aestivum]